MTFADKTSLAGALNGTFASLDLVGRLRALRAQVAGRIAFTTSLGLEDQVITHAIAEAGVDVDIVTLDTGRLFPQTYQVWAATEAKYGLKIRAFYPQTEAVEQLVTAQGIDGFYHAVSAREACCHVRKVEPLARALNGADVWITGLRADQSGHRQGMGFVTFEAGRGLIKANPLLDWTREAAAQFAAQHEVPINELHAQGFLSIGCAPCTRAIKAGEPERAGRWWWEDEAKKECGLHVDAQGRLVRTGAGENAS